MPAGHVTGAGKALGSPAPAAAAPAIPAVGQPDPFVQDFVTDLMPYVEKNYRVSADRANTAIAGLSMGGSQTLNIAMAHPDRFAYIGVYSSGLLGVFPVGGRGGAAAPVRGERPPRQGHDAVKRRWLDGRHEPVGARC